MHESPPQNALALHLLFENIAAGTEVLKALVLGGVGRITVVDSEPCSNRDLGENYAIESSHVEIGKSRSAAVTESTGRGCIDKNGVEDCRTCALHFADCVASPHTDDDGMPKILSVDECIDEVASAAKGCSKCKSKESKAAWRIRVGDPSP